MKKLYLSICAAALLFCSCENNMQESAENMAVNSTMELGAPPAMKVSDAGNNVNKSDDVPDPEMQKKLIKNGSLRIEVENYAEARPKISQLITNHHGYISSENETNSGALLQNKITIRVPYNEFDALVGGLEKVAKYVEGKSVNVQDVTAQFVDIEARLKTRREVMLRYMEFLKKAKNIEETLKIEEEIRQLREETESAEGQLKLLSDQVKYSTLQLDVFQNLPYKIEPVRRTGFFSKTGEAFLKGWYILLDFIIGIIYLWPFFLIAVAVLYFLRKRRLKK